jgi:hypothetical protein
MRRRDNQVGFEDGSLRRDDHSLKSNDVISIHKEGNQAWETTIRFDFVREHLGCTDPDDRHLTQYSFFDHDNQVQAAKARGFDKRDGTATRRMTG